MTLCLACGSDRTRIILDFGLQPAANLLPMAASHDTERVRLALRFCDACGHGQQDEFFPAEKLFGNYLYQSGTTRTLADYFVWLAARIAEVHPRGGRLLELASNDGSFLKAAIAAGLDATGVEPAENLVRISHELGLEVIHGFWPGARSGKRFERVVAMNVLAHGPDPLGFLLGIKEALTPDGVAYIQVSQADMFRNFEFDTLYHEHYSFFCPSSLDVLARRAGLPCSRFCKTDIHGGSILAVLGSEKRAVDEAFGALLSGDFTLGELDPSDRPSPRAADLFQSGATATCNTVRNLCKMGRMAGMTVVMVGAAAKAITVMQASSAIVDAVLDEAPLKIGRFIPGTDLEIKSFQTAAELPPRCLFVIGAWNFKMEIDAKLRKIRGTSGDLSCAYFPTLTISAL